MNSANVPTLRTGDALLLIDIQKDFCKGGELAVEDGDGVVPICNRWIDDAVSAGVPILASRDWHPVGHPSFRESGGPWPAHCIQDSDGARFHPDLRLPPSTIVVTKGVRFDHDQYSAFDETGLGDYMRRQGVARVLVAGLAEDVCVRASVLDGRTEGFEVVLIADGTRPVNRADGLRARDEMRDAGVQIALSSS
jgi:nicotinamidase/pyrazinamidase